MKSFYSESEEKVNEKTRFFRPQKATVEIYEKVKDSPPDQQGII